MSAASSTSVISQNLRRLRSQLSWVKQSAIMSLPKHRKVLEEIVSNLDDCHAVYEKTVVVRNWIKSHSVHLIDDEHDSYAFNLPLVMTRLLNCAKGDGAVPHLSCGPRAYAMKAILDRLNIANRIIDLFGVSGDHLLRVSPHTLIEVYAADTQRWSLQDPDFNVVYVNVSDGQPVSLRDALCSDIQLSFDAGGYLIENPINLDNTIAALFNDCALYRMSYEGKKSRLLLNRNRFALDSLVWFEERQVTLHDYVAMRAGDFDVEFFS